MKNQSKFTFKIPNNYSGLTKYFTVIDFRANAARSTKCSLKVIVCCQWAVDINEQNSAKVLLSY